MGEDAGATHEPASIDIRPVTADFAAELADLCAVSFTEAYRGVNTDADIRTYCETSYAPAALAANLTDPALTYRVAFAGERAVGFFLLHERPCPRPVGAGATELKQLYVLAAQYGTGLGARLLHEAARCAAGRGRRHLWLSVSDLNQRAQRFYRKHGFTAAGAAPRLEVGDARLPATVMVCEVAALVAAAPPG